MARIKEDSIRALRDNADLKQVVEQHVSLKRAGSGRWKGLCFAGDTEFLTVDGPQRFDKTVGTTQRVLTATGRWVDAPIHAYGVHPLRRVTMTRNGLTRDVYATAEHIWFVADPHTSAETERATDDLEVGDTLAYRLPPSHVTGLHPDTTSAQHGFLFGNTHLRVRRPMHPLIDSTAPHAQLYGWLAGWFAADGHVTADGAAVLTSTRRDALEHAMLLCLRLGVGTYEITPATPAADSDPRWQLELARSTLTDAFFLVPSHRAAHQTTPANGELAWTVTHVEPSSRVEEVYCAVVPDTESFCLDGYTLVHNCPFHSERTPSFTIEPAKALFHCFGCQAGGDVFTFVQQLHNVGFVEAVEETARMVGWTLEYEEVSDAHRQAIGHRTRLREANDAADAYFRELLHTDAGAPARDYLTARGFDQADIDRWGLGYSPADPSTLVKEMSRRGWSLDELYDAGLATKTERGPYGMFRGRLIIPLRDIRGDVIGFAGRVLPDQDGPGVPKYINTPETAVYKKSDVLFGLHQARSAIAKRGEAVLVEGYTDVMALHRAGIDHAVATCGTALADGHVRLLARSISSDRGRLILMFDGDTAGMDAAERGWHQAQTQQLRASVLLLPEGTDPADLAASVGPDGVRAALQDSAVSAFTFALERRRRPRNLTNPEDKTAFLDDACQLLASVVSVAERATLIDYVASQAQVGSDVVRARCAELNVGLVAAARRPAAVGSPAVGAAHVAARTGPYLEADVLWVALNAPELLPDPWWDLTEEMFTHPPARAAFVALNRAGGAGVDVPTVMEATSGLDTPEAVSGAQRAVRALALAEAAPAALADNPQQGAHDLIVELHRRWLRAERTRVLGQMRLTDPASADYATFADQVEALTRALSTAGPDPDR